MSDNQKFTDYESSVDDSSYEEDTDSELEKQNVETEKDQGLEEVQKLSRADTRRIRLWRFFLVLSLLLIAGGASYGTYKFLKSQEGDTFHASYEKFSSSISSAVYDKQARMRLALASFANTLTATGETLNATWPFFALPLFESFADTALFDFSKESVVVFNLVLQKDKDDYLTFTSESYKHWVEESYLIKYGAPGDLNSSTFHPFMTQFSTSEGYLEDTARDIYFAATTKSPPAPTYDLINYNAASNEEDASALATLLKLKNETITTKIRLAVDLGDNQDGSSLHNSPQSILWYPVHKRVGDIHSDIVAAVGSSYTWEESLIHLLPKNVDGIHVILKNDCNQVYSYVINGPDVEYLGEGDLHQTQYDSLEVAFNVTPYNNSDFLVTKGHCRYTMHIYPTVVFESSYETSSAAQFTAIVAASFFFVAILFLIYDIFVQRRNNKLIKNAARSNAIVASLFPGNVRDRLISGNNNRVLGQKRSLNLKKYIASGGVDADNTSAIDSPPLADLFLETTVLFADIVGFTAWSSTREPAQVFKLLETVYSAFDEIAKARRVFKVETVGDCYVAATGIPEYRRDHAIVMCRFARDILFKMGVLTKELEVTLGPDTADLDLRIGIHSGPVTAGVLRGAKARFQLFGDTMNTTSRIESSSEAGRIQMSQETADLLIRDGKGHWMEQRDEKVQAKGKGEIQTYWLLVAQKGSDSKSTGGSDDVSTSHVGIVESDREAVRLAVSDARTSRLIDWNTETLLRLIKQIVARRYAYGRHRKKEDLSRLENMMSENPLEEVVEIITLPEFDPRAAKEQKEQHPDDMELSETIATQLRDYVTCIASMYRNNPFHNFEHASHVTMSVIKLLSRIVAPSDLESDVEIHDHTYGITSDPLTQFACAFSALIHDVEHTGVPNAQLVKEKARIAAVYKERSVAEQNSLVLAWTLMMDDTFEDLRHAIYTTEGELLRFRQLVVNSVMATDIVDKDLKGLRNARWEKAFNKDQPKIKAVESRVDINRKATIVIEHLIQASDVAHTMQHWHVYRKWNERFFRECYAGFKAGRAETDPSINWYKGEIGFFDFYIIPLAKKLKDCGVFGVSSDEYLNYAMKNRAEWEVRGQEVVSEMMQRIAVQQNEQYFK